MAKDEALEQFYNDFMEEVEVTSDMETSGWKREDFLTSLFLEYLEEAGEYSDTIMCPFRSYRLQLNAYSIAEDFSNVDLFVCIYSDSEKLRTIPASEVDTVMKRAVQLYQKATNDLYTSFQKDNDTYEFAITINQHKGDIQTVRICLLTNGLVNTSEFNKLILDDVEISFTVWDMERLYRCVSSGKMREVIEIDFEEKFGETLPCIENTSSDTCDVYLAMISGEWLAQLYEEYRDRLLEKNVRSFLSVRGGVNKGIRNTLRDEPDMFLAYNNGITVTAEDADIIRDDNGKPSIRSVRDLQIVNGGQTTASIYNAYRDKRVPCDLSNVFVQMKMSVISSEENIDAVVSNISRYANTQNKIQMADFSANDPYHRKIEELSRTIWAPAQNGAKPVNWFYERARGQYADMLSLQTTTLRKKQFKETHPMFTKTDLAKYENTWDQLPYYVSEGAQKNFRRFTLRLNERKAPLPDEKQYQNMIAKAIMFRKAEKIVQDQNFGGYRANIVTYTLAFLSYKTAQRIDLERIWREQDISAALTAEIIAVSKLVHGVIINPPGEANISEWCKKEKCWNDVKEIKYTISKELDSELITGAYKDQKSTPINGIDSLSEDELKLIDETAAVPAETWFALSSWAKETNNFQPWLRSMLFNVGTLAGRGKKPSIKQSRHAMKALKDAKDKGFTEP